MKTLTVASILIWLAAALVGGWFGIFARYPDSPPVNFGLFIGLPILYFAALYRFCAPFRQFTHSISLPLIVGTNVWRFVGVGFLVAYYFGRLPAGFAIPAGVGDTIAAIFALPLALALTRGAPVRGLFIAWNVFGLLDLIVAITLGVLHTQTPFGILRTDVSTALMTTFPVNVIPTFFVPLFILLHTLSLLRYKEVKAG